MKISKKIKIYTIISFIFLSIFSVLLYFYCFRLHTLFGARDLQFHIRRIMELKDNLLMGNILPSLGINYFHGSAVMGMYPYISLYPIIPILLVTHSVIASYYIYITLIIFLSLIISFFSSLNYSKSIKISYLFAITYGMSSSFIFEFFANGDLGVAISMAILPLVIFGFIDVLNNQNNYIKLTVGVTLLTFCQLPSTAIIILFLCLWLLININSLNKEILKKLFKASCLIVLLTSIIWIPIIHIELFNNIRTVNKVFLKGTSAKFFIENLSIIPMITIIITGIIFKKLNKINKQMYILSILVIISASKLMPWHFITSLPLLRALNQFQFTFRFLIIPQILLSYLFSITCIRFINNYKITKKTILITTLIFIILLQASSQFLTIHKKVSAPSVTFNTFRYLKYYETNLHNRNNNIGYKITPSSIKYFDNGYYDNSDYYPKSAMAQRKNIYNNYATYHRHNNIHHIIILHNHNDTFTFHTNKKINKLSLPFVTYNKEPVKVSLNHQSTHCYSDNHVMFIKNIKRGNHQLMINPTSNYKFLTLESLLSLMGISWIITEVAIRSKKHMN